MHSVFLLVVGVFTHMRYWVCRVAQGTFVRTRAAAPASDPYPMTSLVVVDFGMFLCTFVKCSQVLFVFFQQYVEIHDGLRDLIGHLLVLL